VGRFFEPLYKNNIIIAFQAKCRALADQRAQEYRAGDRATSMDKDGMVSANEDGTASADKEDASSTGEDEGLPSAATYGFWKQSGVCLLSLRLRRGLWI